MPTPQAHGFRTALKSLLRHISPATTEAFITARRNRHARQVLNEAGIPKIVTRLREHYGPRILLGPFAGMVYDLEGIGSTTAPKVVGSYEAELHGFVETAVATPYHKVIDIGAAEGYYAVGFAMRAPASSVVAYDIDRLARGHLLHLARVNGVADRVQIRSQCTPAELHRVTAERSLVICDVEGYEVDLLDPALVPTLQHCDLLVEFHDHARPGASTAIRSRFETTHRITTVYSATRDPDEWPVVDVLPPEDRSAALSEFRNATQQWAFLQSKRFGQPSPRS